MTTKRATQQYIGQGTLIFGDTVTQSRHFVLKSLKFLKIVFFWYFVNRIIQYLIKKAYIFYLKTNNFSYSLTRMKL
jgi:hypothetical protein